MLAHLRTLADTSHGPPHLGLAMGSAPGISANQCPAILDACQVDGTATQGHSPAPLSAPRPHSLKVTFYLLCLPTSTLPNPQAHGPQGKAGLFHLNDVVPLPGELRVRAGAGGGGQASLSLLPGWRLGSQSTRRSFSLFLTARRLHMAAEK